jgi:Putative beta-barrel porin-2, OmpL-like. bbp2
MGAEGGIDMTPMRIVSSAVLAGLIFAAPALATAESAEVERQIQETQARMQQLDDEIQAASDQLDEAKQRVDEQSELIERSGLAAARGASSGLPGFLGQIAIGGSVQASYFWNTNGPTAGRNGGMDGTNAGLNEAFYPLHPDSNSFALQAAWIDLEREIDEENRAGFRLEVAYGKTGELIGGIGNREIRDDSGFYVFDGYVQYLAPIGDGVTFKAGRFGTTIGSEYANDALNWNITQGSVYNLLEPLDHIGVTAEYAFGDSGFDAKLGAVNGFFANDPDNNESKSILGHVGWENDLLSISLNGIWGNEETASSENSSGVANVLFTIDPTDRLSFWVNADYNWIDLPGDPHAWGVAAAGRFAFTDRTSLAIRAEYATDDENFFGFVGFDPDGDIPGPDGRTLALTDVRVWGVTATLDHLLTDNLKIRGEVRYDDISKKDTSDGEFFENSSGFSDDQVVIGAEVIYNFNAWGSDE